MAIDTSKLINILKEKAPYLLRGLSIDGNSSNKFIKEALERGYDPVLIENSFFNDLMDFDVPTFSLNHEVTNSLVPDALAITNGRLAKDFNKVDIPKLSDFFAHDKQQSILNSVFKGTYKTPEKTFALGNVYKDMGNYNGFKEIYYGPARSFSTVPLDSPIDMNTTNLVSKINPQTAIGTLRPHNNTALGRWFRSKLPQDFNKPNFKIDIQDLPW